MRWVRVVKRGVAEGDGWQIGKTPGQTAVIGEERTITFTPGIFSTLQQDGTYRVILKPMAPWML